MRWGTLFVRGGTQGCWIANSKAALALAAYSRDVQFGSSSVPYDAYGGRHSGILYLYGQNDQPGPHDAGLLTDEGEVFSTLDAEQLLDCEPFLHEAKLRFSKAVYYPNDGTGDAVRYAKYCLEQAREPGLKIHFGEKALRLTTHGDIVTGVEVDRQHHAADAVVMAAGLVSRDLLAPLGYALPVHPVTGYSVTYRLHSHKRPRVGAVSIPHKVAWAAFGDETVRFTGYADVGIPDPAKIASHFAALESFAAGIYPEFKGLQPFQMGR